jgi:general secretion pathway protein G
MVKLSAKRGFTLIELLVVMAILATLLTIAAPRYFAHLERAKESALRQTLVVTRDAIDKFHGDTGRLPDSLDELVQKRYLRKLPYDPILESSGAWKLVAPPDPAQPGKLYDIHSGASGAGLDGSAYALW